MSVSNFINGRDGTMTDETRERIAAAVSDLNYRPHSAARSIRMAETRSVGLIVVDESPTYLSDGYTTQLVSGLGDALNHNGYTLQIEGLTADRVRTSRLIRHRQTDGLCILPSGDRAVRRDIVRTAAATGQPFVLLLESLPSEHRDACCVLQSDRAGARELGDHVLGRGARSILLLKQSHNHWQAVTERERGIAEAVAAVPGASMESMACGTGDFGQTSAAMISCLESNGLPDAIMATNDQIGIAVLKDLKVRGLSAPHDVLVTGFNAFDFWQFSDPVLTTVRSPGFDLGQQAAEAMITRLSKGGFPRRRTVLETSLLLGETT